jgi:hypothetical protein
VIFDAYQSLITQTLASDQTDEWRAAILAAIGGMAHAQLLIDAVPNLAQLLGPAPPLGALQPAEASALFSRLFVALTSVFATPAHPLVIFIGTPEQRTGPQRRGRGTDLSPEADSDSALSLPRFAVAVLSVSFLCSCLSFLQTTASGRTRCRCLCMRFCSGSRS